MPGIKVGIIGGSGMDDPQLLKEKREKKVKTPYGSPSSPLTIGKIDGVDTVILARHGKGHTIYPTGVNFRANIHALKKEGCTHILATTAVGSLREKIRPGDLVFVDQFIDFTRHRTLTFHDEKVIHTPMAEPFCKDLRALLIRSAKELKLRHHPSGTVVTIEGPRFSTRAESHMFRMLGADVINMSTVPEVVLAREAGICYQTIAMSTDYDCWKEGEEPVTWEMILSIMSKNAENVRRLLLQALTKIKDTGCAVCK
ncbi:MAG: S-methyl-5'-thioadenosine phosphorylase [Alphaproteobacteria bacterium]|uniref:Purine nucleoside phosphorylase n=1 Tax=Candidatus Nitrobium versatile TaxID=2884831 RepID=A0A953M149_9BACT|nr:S-methyl-5'-thioadenosine phosphorylase [Candidatus Nitrobium versatile]